ncbi:hypothetical protein D3C72_1434800 [compost metagenome]
MASARQPGWARIHSMPIEPLPAPTSHNSSPGIGARRARVMARTSRLVSWPSCLKAESGRPASRDRRSVSGSAMHSIAIRFRSAITGSVQSLAIPSTRRSASPPKCSSTVIRLGPKPRSRSSAAMAAGLRPSLLNTSKRTPLDNCALSAATGRATTDNVTTSCKGQPIRAAASEQEEGAGRISISSLDKCRERLAPTPKNIGSPLARTQTGSPCFAKTGSRAKGLGHNCRTPQMQAGNRSSCR